MKIAFEFDSWTEMEGFMAERFQSCVKKPVKEYKAEKAQQKEEAKKMEEKPTDIPAVPTEPVAPMETPATAIPTSAPAYSVADIQTACAELVRQGTIAGAGVKEMLGQFNVTKISDLASEQYDGFVAMIGEKGARI